MRLDNIINNIKNFSMDIKKVHKRVWIPFEYLFESKKKIEERGVVSENILVCYSYLTYFVAYHAATIISAIALFEKYVDR
jgi:hypothetical protein